MKPHVAKTYSLDQASQALSEGEKATLSERSSSSPNKHDIAEDTASGGAIVFYERVLQPNTSCLAGLIVSAQPLIVKIIFDGAGISSPLRDREGAGNSAAAPVNSIGWPHTRARAVVDSAAADFIFRDYQITPGRTCCVVR